MERKTVQLPRCEFAGANKQTLPLLQTGDRHNLHKTAGKLSWKTDAHMINTECSFNIKFSLSVCIQGQLLSECIYQFWIKIDLMLIIREFTIEVHSTERDVYRGQRIQFKSIYWASERVQRVKALLPCLTTWVRLPGPYGTRREMNPASCPVLSTYILVCERARTHTYTQYLSKR